MEGSSMSNCILYRPLVYDVMECCKGMGRFSESAIPWNRGGGESG